MYVHMYIYIHIIYIYTKGTSHASHMGTHMDTHTLSYIQLSLTHTCTHMRENTVHYIHANIQTDRQTGMHHLWGGYD